MPYLLAGCLGGWMKNKLTAIAIKNAPDDIMRDGGGLSLTKSGAREKWIYRYSHLGRRRETGLRQWPTVSLSDARKLRDTWAAELASGNDAIGTREANWAAEIAERDR